MTRVAAVDCGTNSIRLLVADAGPDGALSDVHREMRIVRLGEGVDATGVLSEAALARTFAALREYVTLLDGVDRVRMVATSATRDASNSSSFVSGCVEVLGVAPEVVSGEEEARLSFLGATSGLRGFPAPYAVCDIGGGSTELVLGSSSVAAACSIDVGCVRLTERRLRSDPPLASEVAAAVADAAAALDRVPFDVGSAATFVGLAGSVTTVTALALGLPAYDPAAIHHARVPVSVVEEVTASLLAMSRTERAALPAMHPGRVDVIGAGALVLREVMRRWDLPEVVASEHDILDGIALSAAS